ncbi:MAG: leucine-rich repeat domain-containing protein [Rhodothermales bacterium]
MRINWILFLLLSGSFLCLKPTPAQAQEPAFIGCDAVLQIPRTECIALITLFNQTNGIKWAVRGGWGILSNPCDWVGVVCNSQPWPRNVVQIELVNNDLTGSLPVELPFLTELTHLVLENRPNSGDLLRMGGTLPPGIGELSKLEVLKLGHNEITGSVPDEYGNLENLQVLELSNNRLDDFLPESYGNLKALRILDLSNNSLRGEIPVSYGLLENLISLNLGGNRLDGSIPEVLSELKNLRNLHLESNQFTGLIPKALSKLPALNLLSLSDNSLRGPLSVDIARLSENLGFCSFERNAPLFCIPDRDAYRLTDNNTICGVPLDSDCSYCNNSSAIAPSDCRFLESLYYETAGYDWLDESGWLVNTDPCTWFGIGCEGDRVSKIALSANNLSGSLPDVTAGLEQLDMFDLSSNMLEGIVPFSIAELGANTSSCSLAQSGDNLCIPAESPYESLGLPAICGLPLDTACTVETQSGIASFSAEVKSNTVRFQWSVAEQTAGATYELEQKFDNQFIRLQQFTASENTEERLTLERSLLLVDEGPYTFRLKQISADGRVSLSEEINVIIDQTADVLIESIFPNPTSATSTLQFALLSSQHIEVSLYNPLGQRIRTLFSASVPEKQTQTLHVTTSDLANGLYLIRVQGESFVISRPVTVSR